MKILKFIAAVGFAFFIKLFVFQPFVIPSSSMDKTLVKGDYVMVNTWQNTLFGNLLDIQLGDVVAFHYPLEKAAIKSKMVFIKRCVALPGDSLILENGKIALEQTKLQFDYLIADPDGKLNWEILKDLGIHLGGKATNNRWLLSLDSIQISALLEVDQNLKFTLNSSPKDKIDLSTFPSDTTLKWNRDFFGPLYVPEKGAEIKIDYTNFSLYEKIISDYENHSCRLQDSVIYIDNKQTETYTFSQNYYFMMGDNRHHSQDSRYWGFVPEDHLIGTCSRILFNADEFTSKRLLKRVY